MCWEAKHIHPLNALYLNGRDFEAHSILRSLNVGRTSSLVFTRWSTGDRMDSEKVVHVEFVVIVPLWLLRSEEVSTQETLSISDRQLL